MIAWFTELSVWCELTLSEMANGTSQRRAKKSGSLFLSSEPPFELTF
jgi:hypothetical protein